MSIDVGNDNHARLLSLLQRLCSGVNRHLWRLRPKEKTAGFVFVVVAVIVILAAFVASVASVGSADVLVTASVAASAKAATTAKVTLSRMFFRC